MFQSEIPQFLKEHVICVANIFLSAKHKSTLLLTKQLQLYEFKNKLLLSQIDLNETCLAKERERTKHVGKTTTTDCIKFGKYVYKHNSNYNHYILLQYWEELVALKHTPDTGFVIIGEWSKVKNFQLIHGTMQYQAMLQIQLENDDIIKTDLQMESSDAINDMVLRKQFESTLQQVEQLKTELQMQKEFTRRDLQNFRNEQYFGNHLVRSAETEELQPLTRYGDIWMRLTAADELVVGVPLVNNCSAPNLTTLTNIQAILFNGESFLKKFEYKCRLYQLKQRFEDLETIESFFQANETDKCESSSWECSKSCQLPPEGFAVLVLTFDIAHLVLMQTICPLIITYEIEKDLQLLANKPAKLKVFKQQLFVKALNFSKIIASRKDLEVRFEDKSLHQDLLAICSSHYEFKLHIKFENNNDAAHFEQLLRKAFHCERIKRSGQFNHSDMDMDFDEEDTQINHFPHMLLYNNKINAYWYGLLIICEETKFSCLWKFFVVNETRGLLLLRLILDDLLREKINVKEIKLISEKDIANKSNTEATLRNTLNLELACIIEILNNANNLTMESYVEKMIKLTKLRMSTDLAMSATYKKCEFVLNCEKS